MTFPLTDIIIGFFVLGRTAGFLMMIPYFSGKIIPLPVRFALAITFAILIYPKINETTPIPSHVLGLFLIFAKEFLFGTLMGFGARIAFWVAEFAGSVISTEIGLSMSSNFDPIAQTRSTVISTALFYMTAILFFITGVHYQTLHNFVMSYYRFPVLGGFPAFRGVEGLVKATSLIFLVGAQAAAPAIALNFVINVTFAIMGKAVPKMNVFMVSFSVRILAGLTLLFLTVGLITQYLYKIIDFTPRIIIDVITF